MKKTFVYPTAFLCLILTTFACSKDQQDAIISQSLPDQTINAKVVVGESYTFVAGYSGTLSISKQALHYEMSETANENGSVYYNYHPKPGFIGDDEVTLAYVNEISSASVVSNTGCPGSHSASTSTMQKILIKLTVTK